eukprot:scaffold73164_cov12-Tisochrysis_lutea.AAC.1
MVEFKVSKVPPVLDLAITQKHIDEPESSVVAFIKNSIFAQINFGPGSSMHFEDVALGNPTQW